MMTINTFGVVCALPLARPLFQDGRLVHQPTTCAQRSFCVNDRHHFHQLHCRWRLTNKLLSKMLPPKTSTSWSPAPRGVKEEVQITTKVIPTRRRIRGCAGKGVLEHERFAVAVGLATETDAIGVGSGTLPGLTWICHRH